MAQLLETTLLNLVNFPSLIATNASRMRLAAGPDKVLLEFGLRRAQGPDGGLSASKYSYIGGFDGTSHVLAGKIFGISVKGTHAHSFVMSYTGLSDLTSTTIASSADPTVQVEFLSLVLEKRRILGFERSNESELSAFIAYAQSFPNGVVALVDTYDTLSSGVPNFIAVGWALDELGYKPLGVRLDSGDLAYLSKEVRAMFCAVDEKVVKKQLFAKCTIAASNDINEDVLMALNRQGHAIDIFGIGTHLVTCQRQPALGCVYKLVEINGKPRIKLSQEAEKLVIPAKKNTFRLFGKDGHCLVDLMQLADEEPPQPGLKILVRDPFSESKRAYVTPVTVEPLLNLVFDGSAPPGVEMNSLEAAKAKCKEDLQRMRVDHIRPLNPTPYKVSVSQRLYDYMHKLWMEEAPIADLS